MARTRRAQMAPDAERPANAPEIPASAAPGGNWQRSEWSGREQWVCSHCQWDTLDGARAAQEHAAQCQFCGGLPQSGLILVADRAGNPVGGTTEE